MFKCIVYVILLIITINANPDFSTNYKASFPKVRIVGGHDTDIALHPWQVSIRWLGAHVCGGSIISDRWIATAAHCFSSIFPRKLYIKVGSTYLSSGGNDYIVNNVTIHPNWTFLDEGMNNDIALLRLQIPINCTNASAVQLPAQNQILDPGINLTVTGWGDTEEDSDLGSEVLQQVVVPVVSQEECISAYDKSDTITENMFCAGFEEGGKDSCQGDSGGPAVVDGILVGIISFGHGCGEPHYPGVYTKVSNYIDWINSVIGI